MKKKIIALLVAAIAMITLFACGTEETAAPSVPTGVAVTGDTFSWQAVDGAESYTVSINGIEVSGVKTTSVDLTSQAIVDKLSEGDNTLKVKSVSGELSSEYSEAKTYNYVAPKIKLAAPVIGFNSSNPIRVEWAAVANAAGYKINVDGEDMAGKLTDCYYDFLPNVESAAIKVKALGSGKYLDSDYSNSLDFVNESPDIVKLAAPTLTVNLKTVTWADIQFAESYKVSVNGSDFEIAASPFELAETAVGTYEIKVKAIGDGILYGDSDEASTEIVISKLLSPSLTVTGNTVTWDNIAGAIKYQAKVNGGDFADATSPFTLSQTEVGDYVVKVIAVGNGITILNSDEAMTSTISIIKLDTPSNLVFANNRLTWQGNASKYKIVVTKDSANPQEFDTTTNYKDFAYTEAGEYSFIVTAKSSNALEVDSDSSAPFVMTINDKVQLSTPKNAAINGNIFSWDTVVDATGYIVEVKLNGEIIESVPVTGLTYTFDKTTVGVYSLRVKAVSSDTEAFVNSEFSVAVTKTVTQKLAAPVIQLDDTVKNKITWSAVADATAYEIYINDIKQPSNVTATEYTVTVALGTFKVRVKAVAAAPYEGSDLSNEVSVKIVKLSLTGVTVDGRTISWTVPDGAVKVSYKINDGEWTDSVDNSISVPSTVNTYSVKIQAIGDGVLFLNSDEITKTISVSKLNKPTLEIDNADKRKVIWNTIANAQFMISTDNINFTSNDTYSYILDKAEAGTYTLYVKAIGVKDNYLDSDVAQIDVVFTKLSAPTQLSYDVTTGLLTWTGEGVKFVISVDLNGTKTEYESTTKSYNLGLAAAGTYSVTVKAKGGDKITLDSDSSEVLNITITVETPKLTTPAVTLTGSNLSWNKIDNAQSYAIELSGAKNYMFTVTADDSEAYSFDLSAQMIDAGKYTVKVCAETQSADFVKSDYWTGSYTKTVTLANTTITVSGKNVSWTAVSNAVSYSLYQEVSGEKTLLQDNIVGLSYTFGDMNEPFIGKLYVVAVGDGEVYLNSETIKEDVVISIKLSEPIVIRDDDNRKFTVNKLTGVKDIMYSYTLKGESAGAAVKYVDGIAYGNTAGEYVLNVYYVGDTGYDNSEAYAATYTVLGELKDIVINRDKISFKAVEGVEKYIIKDNDGAYTDFAMDQGLSGGMHRFYISAASNEALILPGVSTYYTVLVISNVEEFNLIVNAYAKDSQNNGADNLWGTSTLIADIPDTTGMIKSVSREGVNYNGRFLGNGHIIGATVPLSGSEGLFGHNYGTIENLTLHVNTDLAVDYVGGIAKDNLFKVDGNKAAKGTLKNIKIYGNVKGGSFVGGLVGANVGDIFNCENHATVTGTGNIVGGIVGDNKSLTVSNITDKGYINRVVNFGAITGSSNVGGIVGCLTSNAVDGALNKGRVVSSADGWGIGGIVGITADKEVRVFDSMNMGEIGVTGKGYNVGGIVGKHGTDDFKNAAILNSINIGKVNTANASENAAGLVAGTNFTWKDPAVPTDKWSLLGGIWNSAYLEATEGVTITVGQNKNGGLNEDINKIDLTYTQAQANAMCASMNGKSLNKEADVFKVVERADGNYYVIVAWCEAYII